MPSGTGLDLFGKEFPDRTFDVGIAEQHARDVRGRARDRRLQAVLRDLLDLPAARLRSGRARRRDPEAAGPLRDRPRRSRRRRRSDARRLVRSRLSRLPAGLRHHGGGRRGRTRAHGRDRRRDRRPAERLPLSARRRRRRRDAGRRRSARDRPGPHRARRLQGRDAVARHAACRMPAGRRSARRDGPVDHGRRRPLRQAARHRL